MGQTHISSSRGWKLPVETDTENDTQMTEKHDNQHWLVEKNVEIVFGNGMDFCNEQHRP